MMFFSVGNNNFQIFSYPPWVVGSAELADQKASPSLVCNRQVNQSKKLLPCMHFSIHSWPSVQKSFLWTCKRLISIQGSRFWWEYDEQYWYIEFKKINSCGLKEAKTLYSCVGGWLTCLYFRETDDWRRAEAARCQSQCQSRCQSDTLSLPLA